jgi:hypothetical protein
MWATFKLTLNHQAALETDQEIVIAAAADTFRQFKAILTELKIKQKAVPGWNGFF